MTPNDRTDRRRVAAVEAWFEGAARDLPWRRMRGGWPALVSELMLQQTQVSRVIPAFEAFMVRFPTPAALALATEQAVLEAWEGMGYYRRARHLHAAAKQIVAQHGGEVPGDALALRALPGVGRYTAGAIASIVFGHAEALVDGNVERVFARWAGIRTEPDASAERAAHRQAWQRAEALVQLAEKPGRLNEGLMELGATVCTPARPACAACPVSACCAAHLEGRTHEIPAPKIRAARSRVFLDAAWVRIGRDLLMQQRAADGLWAGLWQLPSLETTEMEPPARSVVQAWVSSTVIASGRLDEIVAERTALLTHRKVTLRVWRVDVDPGSHPEAQKSRGTATASVVRLSLEEAIARPMSALSRRVLPEVAQV